MSEKEFVYKSTLSRVYGLTPSMIEELEPPDLLVDNPHYKNAAPGCLFRIERVESWIEQHEDRVAKARASREKRAAAKRQVQERRRNDERSRAMKWLESVPLSVESLPLALLDKADKHYKFAADFDFATDKGLRAYVRHHQSNYHSLLQELRGFDGWLAHELYPILRKRIDAAVEAGLTDWNKEHGHILLIQQQKEGA